MRLNRRGGDSGPPSFGHLRPRRPTTVGSMRSVAVSDSAPGQLVEAVAPPAGGALHERVAEAAHVAGRHPHLRVHEDPGVQPHDVVAVLDHRPPPRPLDVVLELDAEGSVVPHGVDAAVDLAARVDEPATLRERHDRVQLGDGGRDGVRVRAGLAHGDSGVGWVADASRARRPARVNAPVRRQRGCRVSAAAGRPGPRRGTASGARLPLEGVGDERAHGGLHLALHLRQEAQVRDRLGVEALVRPEHLERVQAQAGPGRPAARRRAGRARRRAAAPSGTCPSARAAGRTRRTARARGATPSSAARCISYQRATRPGPIPASSSSYARWRSA